MSSFNVKNDLSWRDILIRSALIIGTAVIIVWLMPRSTYMNFKIERGKPWAHTDLKPHSISLSTRVTMRSRQNATV